MSNNIVEKVKDFLVKLVKDESFRTQLMSDKAEEIEKVMNDSGYNFSQNEFEQATIKILELKELGEFQELSEEELLGAVGGAYYGGWRYIKWPIKWPIEPTPQPLYGTIVEEPIKPEPTPQPLYGGVIQPIHPPQAIAMYGNVMPDEQLFLSDDA